mmetsp:Transcript_6983/g.11870  ORF Transcript_6983/g.11870 Transcript_6983/m.11870 type:complete len:139 (+) Transcript_6983:180-596(+)|eukprot:CAMPEP_0119103852 /NCGR_PEP_ID=MMETSP1180-20130426/2210_1 /TAXON_ID=3052 ORGANISM="Chlamydomonas cf sp, Strain CCMP681" /NCGR_SAMPLE_ID=MMETSP1180 /ASSEMBLY_ACC=CAM_ASM_000741 /LENGTH=138 /DNA_ID=CAMNT_0007088455 /DNA_START=180 /DNA_END=596 /DNA_ORIENTATION=-
MAKLPEGSAALLERLEEQPNLVPDELTRHLMRRSGQDCHDPKLVRLVSLAAQRFIGLAIFDSLQLCKARLGTASKKQLKAVGLKDKRVLTTEDLGKALKDFGITVRPWPYMLDVTGATKTGVATGGTAGAAVTPATSQ